MSNVNKTYVAIITRIGVFRKTTCLYVLQVSLLCKGEKNKASAVHPAGLLWSVGSAVNQDPAGLRRINTHNPVELGRG